MTLNGALNYIWFHIAVTSTSPRRNGKEVWDLPGGYEYFDAKHRSIIALSITLRYRGMAPLEKPLTPKEKAKEAKIDEFHDDVCR